VGRVPCAIGGKKYCCYLGLNTWQFLLFWGISKSPELNLQGVGLLALSDFHKNVNILHGFLAKII